jgi:molybdopterin-guanine dinucleotide biosynthesis protein A
MPFIQPMVKTVPFTQDWQHLTNFNTPQEFEQACAALPT